MCMPLMWKTCTLQPLPWAGLYQSEGWRTVLCCPWVRDGGGRSWWPGFPSSSGVCGLSNIIIKLVIWRCHKVSFVFLDGGIKRIRSHQVSSKSELPEPVSWREYANEKRKNRTNKDRTRQTKKTKQNIHAPREFHNPFTCSHHTMLELMS